VCVRVTVRSRARDRVHARYSGKAALVQKMQKLITSHEDTLRQLSADEVKPAVAIALPRLSTRA
jgi:hypothetical protein